MVAKEHRVCLFCLPHLCVRAGETFEAYPSQNVKNIPKTAATAVARCRLLWEDGGDGWDGSVWVWNGKTRRRNGMRCGPGFQGYRHKMFVFPPCQEDLSISGCFGEPQRSPFL
ncbi:unnamed protein product [Ectocarpus sp. 8 AP-2014]